MFVGGPNSRRDYHLEEGEEVGASIVDNCLQGKYELPFNHSLRKMIQRNIGIYLCLANE